MVEYFKEPMSEVIGGSVGLLFANEEKRAVHR